MIAKKNILILSLVCALFGTAFAAKEEKMPPTTVNVIKATTATWQESINSTGTLVAEQGVAIKPDVAGHITKIFFKSGQYVEAGTPLVQIFPDVLEAQLKQYQATLKLAEVSFKRYADLYRKKAASKSQYDEAEAKFSEAEADVEKIKAQLAQTLVKAPFSGYLGIRKINLGAYVSAGDPIVNLEDTDPMFVDFTVPEIYSKKIKKGQSITVHSEAYGDKAFKGTVLATESLINPNTRMLEIRARIPNKDNVLLSGSFVVTKVYVGVAKQLIKIPQTAIEYSQEGNFVYVVKNSKAVKTDITLGTRLDKDIYITSGLKIGDDVVTAGQQRLFNGASVTIKPIEKKGNGD